LDTSGFSDALFIVMSLQRRGQSSRPLLRRGFFVGYSENSKPYRVYIPSLRKTVVRRDVRFEDRVLRKA
jgi:hypothetical protein